MACTLHPDFAMAPPFPEDGRKMRKVMPHRMTWAAGTNRGPGSAERQREIQNFFDSDEAQGHWAQYFPRDSEGVIHFSDANTAFLCKMRFG